MNLRHSVALISACIIIGCSSSSIAEEYLDFRTPLEERVSTDGEQVTLKAIVPLKFFDRPIDPTPFDPFAPTPPKESISTYLEDPQRYFEDYGLLQPPSIAIYDQSNRVLTVTAKWEEMQFVADILKNYERNQYSTALCFVEVYEMPSLQAQQLLANSAKHKHHTPERNAAKSQTTQVAYFQATSRVATGNRFTKRTYDNSTKGTAQSGKSKLSVLPQLMLGWNKIDLKLDLKLDVSEVTSANFQSVATVFENEYSLVGTWLNSDKSEMYYVVFAKVTVQSDEPIKYLKP